MKLQINFSYIEENHPAKLVEAFDIPSDRGQGPRVYDLGVSEQQCRPPLRIQPCNNTSCI